MTKPIGYGSPPDYTKWKKGQSGNPSGRKKGQRNLATDIADELAATIHLKEGGRAVTLTKQRAMVKALVAKSIRGDTRAIAQLVTLIERQSAERKAAEAASAAEIELSAEDQAIIASFVERQSGEGR
jgi:hypothetical protein